VLLDAHSALEVEMQLAQDISIDALKALADPVRLDICRALANEELCVCHLTEDLGISQPLLSHHMKVLREAGLVETRRHSYWSYYRLKPEALGQLADELARISRSANLVLTARPCPI
jgi:ArsR family transcriptional regulator, arsenate/arsenite/antimonite-responsive transcriptional repressor